MFHVSRKSIVRTFLSGLILFTAVLAGAKDQGHHYQGFVKIPRGRELYVDWRPALEGQPTVVLLNGLTYSTKQWEDFAEALTLKGVGVLRYDMTGMGKTLLKYGVPYEAVPYGDQVAELKELVETLGLEENLNLVGLSYGGGIGLAFAAAHPQMVKNLILMAPYTAPLEEQDQIIRSLISYTRLFKLPWWPFLSEDQLYDFFLAQIVGTTYPRLEPVILENPYKLPAVFRLVQGIRRWTSNLAVPFLPKHSVHLMVAGKDEYIKRKVMEDFWSSIPEEKRASYLVINNSDHKIPETVPHFAASWVNEIVRKNPALRGGRSFEGDPHTGKVRSDDGDLGLPPEEEGKNHLRTQRRKMKGCSDVLR